MLAWMNEAALAATRETGFAHFYSRSRQALWKKGETSGHTLAVREIRIDCDRDAILLLCEPAGPTCHTGAASCFYTRVDSVQSDRIVTHTDDGPSGPPVAILPRLEAALVARRDSDTAKSYTKSLLEAGFPKIISKIDEEASELTAELPDGPRDAVIHETADLLYHVMVGLVARDISIDDVCRELGRRFGVSGHDEKAAR
jgi:phosphoribosyl-ATP pyrophosphohydrolase/phosphoribosyl-AMP cyclohydrolase